MAFASLEISHATIHGYKFGITSREGEVIVVPWLGSEGDYREIRKVQISRMVNIPTIIDFAGKVSKTTSKKAK